jgi:DNA replication protein DnaC
VDAALPLLLKELKLARFRSHWQPLSAQAEAEHWSPTQFLYALCEQELEHRQIARQQRLLRDARLPWQKGLDDFDHRHLEPHHWQDLQNLARHTTWLQQAENVLLFGPSGVGKTHLAIAITMAMVQQDQYCRFFPATTLVQLLQKAKASYDLPAMIQKLDRYALLVIDDIGYVRRSEMETSVLFELICWSSWASRISARRIKALISFSSSFSALSMRSWLMALCLEALALTLVPSSATWPRLTMPAFWHSRRIWTNRPLRASRLRRLNSLIRLWSGCWFPVSTRKARSSWQARSIFRDDTVPTQ